MFKKISLAISMAVVATSSTIAADFEANKALDIFTGKTATEAQVLNSNKAENFEKLYDVAGEKEIAPMAEYTVTGSDGTITIYNDGAGLSQIRGTHKGAQFNSVGASQIPFNGRNSGVQNGNKFVQFFSPKATIIVANNYPANGIDAATQSKLNAMSPGCVTGGKVLTAVVLAKPSGLEVTACYNQVVPLQ